ncbi:DUF5610 domain-containing protein [Rugamonas sp. CCM 8940]|uniref:DUF5610 domain-containing protein n=1 Tax=Rugamonas sp. CCM 8940 TaxID=2765359 RepID=UPI0018F7C660|nr:DUF5610 domain-containing protein [Rugamonas sp. CCM 8940]
MSNPVSVGAVAGAATAAPAAPATENVKTKDDSGLSAVQKAKGQLNASIVQASLTVSIGAGNDPLALLLKSALTGVNEALKDQFGDNAIQNAVSQDNTPEGTAGRIVALSTAFYDAFRQQHPGEDPDVVLQKFLDTIRGGSATGFSEARGILRGLNVLGGGIASNIDKTQELVDKGYADFLAAHKSKPAGDDAAADTAAGAGSTLGVSASAGGKSTARVAFAKAA